MLIKIIITFLLGLLLTFSFNLDFISYSYLVLISVFTSSIYLKDIDHTKYNLNDIFNIIKVICLLSMSFMIGGYYSTLIRSNVSYLEYEKVNIEVTGIIINRENKIDQNILTLKVEEGVDINRNISINEEIKYLRIPVSQFREFELYEKLKVSGQTMGMYKNILAQKRSMFLNYETEKFLEPDTISLNKYNIQIEKIPYETTLSEQIYKYIYTIKLYFVSIVKNNLQEPYSSLATGITFGETSGLSAELRDKFKNSGLIHLMVLSGTNITFLLGVIWYASKRFKLSLRVILSLSIIWLFILLTGLTAPAVRAGVMGSLVVLTMVSGRAYGAPQALALTLFLMTLLDPTALIYSPSLHLSFLACFGLFIVTPTLILFINQIFKNINPKSFTVTSLSLILAMTISTSVYVLGMSGKVSMLGGPATLVAEPFVFSSMIFTFLTIISSFIFSPISDILVFLFSYFNYICTSIFLSLATFVNTNFSTFDYQISRNFVLTFYIFFIFIFIFLYFKFDAKENNLFTK